MLWPGALAQVAFFNAFHDAKGLDNPDGKYFKSMSRYTAFWIAFAAMFAYSWLPGYVAPGLGAVSVLCFLPVGRTIKFLGSSPWYTTLNFLVGAVFWSWIVGPVWHFTSAYNMPQLQSSVNWGGKPIGTNAFNKTNPWLNKTIAFDPIPVYNTNALFDKAGNLVFAKQGVGYPNLLDKKNNLNQAAFDKAEQIYLTASFSLNYFCSFLSLGAVFTQVFLWYGKDVYRQFKDALAQKDSELYSQDAHAQIMKAYPDVKEWMYLVYFVAMFIGAIVVCEVTPFYMQWWLTILCITVGVSFTLPVGIIQAITGYQPGLNILTQVISGFTVPGQTVS
ncbi:hypothetical protein HDU91_002827, partial [Kappamyces sp. JEL0680]